MITELVLKNFKRVEDETYRFGELDLLLGRNNSGKSTVLQALAIWQYCIDEFRQSKSRKDGDRGIQVVLPNFSALPVPEFNLLWHNRIDRRSILEDGKRKPKYILIEILVRWRTSDGEECKFGVGLRYHSPQAIYAIPIEGWQHFRDLLNEDTGKGCKSKLPRIAYVPPFSGLEPTEEWRDDGPIRKQVGKAQPGSVLRNLLLRVAQDYPEDWSEIEQIIARWFSVKLLRPNYRRGVDTQIELEYRHGDRKFDIISGGSGFHQTLTLLAFLFGYHPSSILMDEPDAHLHVNLQREIIDYFKQKSQERGVQFLIATHAEEFARGVNVRQIVSMLTGHPKRVETTPDILRAMSDVSNLEISQAITTPFVLYVEGEDDERLLRAWSTKCDAKDIFGRFFIRTMGGGGKKTMLDFASQHFKAIRQIAPSTKRLILLDYDSDESFHPEPNNKNVFEWGRKNIDSYLLCPGPWKRLAAKQLGHQIGDLFMQEIDKAIDQFFSDQNLTLPSGKTWRDVTAQIFKIIDGKKLLFSNNDSLFQLLKQKGPDLDLSRERVAAEMLPDEIHQDIEDFFTRLRGLLPDLNTSLADKQ